MSKIVIENAEIIKKKKVGPGYFVMTIGPFSRTAAIKAGQFAHIRLTNSNIYFRRAFSVYDVNAEDKSIDILFKVFGRGTRVLAELPEGEILNLMGPLGNGFKLPSRNEMSLLAGGGVGMPPIYFLARQMADRGYDMSKVHFFYGGQMKDDLVEISRIRKLKAKLYPSTDDGSYGFKGLVTEAIHSEIEGREGSFRLYGCGPEGMLKSLDEYGRRRQIPGQLSLEAPMPCGIGVCLGCIRPLRAGGYTRVCREGPVYDIGEVLL
ncbi:putative Dihydroorotate dehydrogenase B (NAD(+)), electron transfer subunit [Candidatus Zixiibacteriota bacterium]|nr:putative Dihydroorotate dehydrogenase B (NAD(+)), electron transfer subunit [candidate division Zixibacteria bacterium]